MIRFQLDGYKIDGKIYDKQDIRKQPSFGNANYKMH